MKSVKSAYACSKYIDYAEGDVHDSKNGTQNF